MAAGQMDALIAAASANPVALANVARTLYALKDYQRACTVAQSVFDRFPENTEAVALASEVLSAHVPRWHFTIVRDEVRNAAYDASLRKAVKPDMRVLDIGSGTGLLAMMAARAGAKHVFTCEMNPQVATAAKAIVAANGLSDRITVIQKHSALLDPVADLGGPVDIVVSEIVSNNLVSEDPLPAMEQAVRRLMKPGGIMIPAQGSVQVALAFHPAAKQVRMGRIQDFDLSYFNRLAPATQHLKVDDDKLKLMSRPAELFRFDFASGGPFPEARSALTLTASEDGVVNGVAQWIRLAMDPEIEYENAPGTMGFSCWAILFSPFESRSVSKGEPVAISGSHDRHTLRIWPERISGTF